MAATDGITVHHRNHRLWQSAYLHLYIKHTQTWHAFFIDIAATPFHVHIATRAERVLHVGQRLTLRYLTHRARQQHHTDVLHLSTHRERLTQLPSGLGRKGITILRAVDGDLGDAIIFFEDNLLELAYFFPVSHIFSELKKSL